MRTIILIVTLFVSLPAISQKKLPNVIEKLTYRGYYNWSFIWINAGSVEMTVRLPTSIRMPSVYLPWGIRILRGTGCSS